MRRASICTAAFGMIGLVFVAPAAAQNMMQHVDLTSPEMTAAEMTRAEVEAVIAAATSAQPADFTGKKLSGLDLSRLDLSGALLRAARLNRTKLTDAKLDRAILDQAWLLEADLSRASLRGANIFAAQMQRTTVGRRRSTIFVGPLGTRGFCASGFRSRREIRNCAFGLFTNGIWKLTTLSARVEPHDCLFFREPR